MVSCKSYSYKIKLTVRGGEDVDDSWRWLNPITGKAPATSDSDDSEDLDATKPANRVVKYGGMVLGMIQLYWDWAMEEDKKEGTPRRVRFNITTADAITNAPIADDDKPDATADDNVGLAAVMVGMDLDGATTDAATTTTTDANADATADAPTADATADAPPDTADTDANPGATMAIPDAEVVVDVFLSKRQRQRQRQRRGKQTAIAAQARARVELAVEYDRLKSAVRFGILWPKAPKAEDIEFANSVYCGIYSMYI